MEKTRNRPVLEETGLVEKELCLAGDPESLEAAFDALSIASKGEGKGKAVELVNRYFDTTDHRLRAEGLAFRVRSAAGNYRQTLKAGDDAHGALLSRDEWETPLQDDRPRPDVLPKKALRLLSKAKRDGELLEVFKTRIRRRTRQLVVTGPSEPSTIEAALDLGDIETTAGSLPVAEIELELLDGHPEALYQLALDLQELTPLRLETRSKSSRAFDALTNQPPRWYKAKPLTLTPADDVNDAMAAIFVSCFDQWLANQAAAFDGQDPEGVHQMRVGLRRLRSAFSVFRKLIPKGQLDWLRSNARQTIGFLGPARDWDVFHSDLLSPVIAAYPDDRTLQALQNRVNARRRSNYRTVRKRLQDGDYTRFALDFGRWLEQRAWVKEQDAKQVEQGAMPIDAFIAKLLGKRHNKALALGENFADLPTSERHELRIALKKLRYAIEFFSTLFDSSAVKPFLVSLKTLQDDLGHMNDVAVAETLLDGLMARQGKVDIDRAAGMVIGWHARGLADLEPQLCAHWSGFAERQAFWA